MIDTINANYTQMKGRNNKSKKCKKNARSYQLKNQTANTQTISNHSKHARNSNESGAGPPQKPNGNGQGKTRISYEKQKT